MTTATTTAILSTSTMWTYHGYFFGGDVDRAGTPIGDLCNGYFVTATDSKELAAAAIERQFAGNAGRFSLRSLSPLPHAVKDAARIAKRGGTKNIPFFA